MMIRKAKTERISKPKKGKCKGNKGWKVRIISENLKKMKRVKKTDTIEMKRK